MSRYRDTQLQVGEITHICLILRQIFANLDASTLISFSITVIWSANHANEMV